MSTWGGGGSGSNGGWGAAVGLEAEPQPAASSLEDGEIAESSDDDYSEAFDDGVVPSPPSDDDDEKTTSLSEERRPVFSVFNASDGQPPRFSFKGFSAGAESFSFAGPSTVLSASTAADQAEGKEHYDDYTDDNGQDD
eukprot:COSAG02_NODE_33996_length_491_cov_0.780612_1_plen_137_part_10